MSTITELHEAAERGEPAALFQLGLMNLKEGWSIEYSPKLSTAADLLGKAIKAGYKDNDAEFLLAQLHSEKKFHGANPQIAIDLYESL